MEMIERRENNSLALRDFAIGRFQARDDARVVLENMAVTVDDSHVEFQSAPPLAV
jgi:hypothetical protein